MRAAGRQWRQLLRARHGVGTFGLDADSVPLNEAIARWLNKLRAGGLATPVDELRYLRQLHAQTAWIEIRGLQVGGGRARRFSIRDLFIPLAAVGPDAEPIPERLTEKDARHLAGEHRTDLLDALRHPRLVVVGDPGSGKTTFLRRIACELCERTMPRRTTFRVVRVCGVFGQDS